MRQLKQPRALATRDRMVREAARLLALKGYHDTKLEDILRAARVTTGAFFHHFQSKEDLGFAVLDRHMEERERKLQQIEAAMPPGGNGDPLQPIFRRLDAVETMVRQRERRKGGCVIGNLSTALSDTHEGFRRRLAQCFEQMAREFQPHLDAAAASRSVDTWSLARYIVAVLEGSIMLARTRRDSQLIARNFRLLKEYLQQTLAHRRAGRTLRAGKTAAPIGKET